MIFWSVDTLDWKTKNVESTVNSILNAKDGDIILLHDIHKTSVDAAIEAIPKMIEKGFQVVTVSEMAEAKENIRIRSQILLLLKKPKQTKKSR